MASNDDTRTLTSAIAAGDPDAFTRFYSGNFAWVVNEVRRFTRRDEHFALDVTQDVMLTAARKMKPLDSHAALRGWLRTTALRHALTRLRAEKRRARREHAAAKGARTAGGQPESTPEHVAWIRSALDAIDPDTRRLIEARFRFGYTLAAAGRASRLTPSAVDGRVSRALSTLQDDARRQGFRDD